MVQVAELAEHLYCDLCYIILREGLLQVAQMIEIILALIQEFIDDIDVVLRLENVQIRLDTLIVEGLQLSDFLRQAPYLALLDAKRLKVDPRLIRVLLLQKG